MRINELIEEIKKEMLGYNLELNVSEITPKIAVLITDKLDWHNDNIEYYVRKCSNDLFYFSDGGYIEDEFKLMGKQNEYEEFKKLILISGYEVNEDGIVFIGSFLHGVMYMNQLFEFAKVFLEEA